MHQSNDTFIIDDITPPSPEKIRKCHRDRLNYSSDMAKNLDIAKNKLQKKRKRTPTITPPRLRPQRESGWDIFPHQIVDYQERNPGTVLTLLPINSTVSASTNGPISQKTRHARRTYIGNLPEGCTDNEIRDFLTGALTAIGGVTVHDEPVLSIYINREKKFAFVEFRGVEECSNCMALEGILWRGSQLRVRRPNDYSPTEAASLGPTTPASNLRLDVIGLANTGNLKSLGEKEDTSDRIFIGGLPHFFTEDQILDIMQPFGEIKAFDLVRDKSSGKSKGYGFCIFTDPSVTDVACSALNGFKLGERSLTVKRALASHQEQLKESIDKIQKQQQDTIEFLAEIQKKELLEMGCPTRFIVLVDCLDSSELNDSEEYEDIHEDMRDVFVKYGLVRNIHIPRPGEKGCGKAIIEFDNVSQAAAARQAVHGKPFNGKPVIAQFIDEVDTIS